MIVHLNRYVWQEANPEARAEADALIAGMEERLAGEPFSIPRAGARFLVARSYATTEAANEYLFPPESQTHDPFLFRNMDAAVRAVQLAIDDQKPVLIHGDYDVDGICATAILYHFLEGKVPKVSRFVPDRRKDGYGIATRAIEWALANNVGLMIAVDCGTSDGELIARLLDKGIEVVVCDHHEFPVDRDVRGIVLNPVGAEETYPFRGLCGAGVAYKLLQALEKVGVSGSVSSSEVLDLVAIATVGDVARLVDENRSLVRAGLRQINREARSGIKALTREAGLDQEITASHIGYRIAPRLNAPGRVSNPKPALALLCEENNTEARRLAVRLEHENNHRKELTKKVHDEVSSLIRDMGENRPSGGFVLSGADWDEGVLGIAAARVVEEFGRPTILITRSGGVGKGSGRSVPGVHLKEQLDRCADRLLKFGGHAQAVGFSIEPVHIELFQTEFTSQLASVTRELPKLPTLRIDSELEIDEVSMELVDFLAACEPFGYGNRTPVWKISGVEVTGETRYVGGDHLKVFGRARNGGKVNAIGFNWRSRGIDPVDLLGRKVDLAVTVKKGYYLKKYYPELHALDIRDSMTEGDG
ncbi:MAG: single-stranded-DNA-specific exonuclease RecJ [bacterium]|nr:single-stranded-DNA-specific exonuclease RecJ [bacterium]